MGSERRSHRYEPLVDILSVRTWPSGQAMTTVCMQRRERAASKPLRLPLMPGSGAMPLQLPADRAAPAATIARTPHDRGERGLRDTDETHSGGLISEVLKR